LGLSQGFDEQELLVSGILCGRNVEETECVPDLCDTDAGRMHLEEVLQCFARAVTKCLA
jgi:hypothetical protein